MSAQSSKTVFILTDTPNFYGNDLTCDDVELIFVKDIKDLLTRLKSMTMAGLVLEIPKVMKASRQDRDRLFNYTITFPLLRTKANLRHQFITYLDPKDSFFKNLDAATGKRARSHERVPVELQCLIAQEDDPSMAEPYEATILDISPGGCFISSQIPFENEHFLHLRIAGLTNPRPIYSSIRWVRTETNPGMGVMFIDQTEHQLEEIHGLQITQPR